MTQGDPLGMMFYGVGILPLTCKLKKGSDFLNEQKQVCDHDANFDWNQNWYADDSACASILKEIVLWLKLLIDCRRPEAWLSLHTWQKLPHS